MNLWDEKSLDYNSKSDLILTYDFELKEYISKNGGNALFIDHLVNESEMHKNNFLIYDFFKNWHYNKEKQDIFIYRDIPFGFALRMEFWNDFVSYSRMLICLNTLNSLTYNQLFLYSKKDIISSILSELNISFIKKDFKENSNISFYFPIEQWMDEKIRPKGIRALLYKIREIITATYGYIMPIMDKLWGFKTKKTIFIQEYHPTKKILEQLRDNKNIKTLLINFSRSSRFRNNLKERLLPISGSVIKYNDISNNLIEKMRNQKVEKLILKNNQDITASVYSLIESRIKSRLPFILRTLDGCINYLDKNNVDLEILIANIGHTATLFDMVCKKKKIPSYLIINGLLGPEYLDDSKYATFINSYSTSIKNCYFKGMDNIVILGDPRMDMYPIKEQNTINRITPTITIGASGFNSVDLNSYVAVEFDFMNDVLESLTKIIKTQTDIKIIIKVRGNGYKNQYEKFIAKFFPNLNIIIEDSIAMKEVLRKTDFYISIYSQTLFEASCLGIPAVYYKKDNEIKDPPFDNKSELVTLSSVNELTQAFYDFQNKHERYDAFLDRKVMEKYIGPLDGKNLERNLDFIHKLLSENKND
jgi:hypothetical protein